MRPGSVACEETGRYLLSAGLAHPVVDITEDADARDYLLSLGELQVPVVIAATGKRWSGHQPTALAPLAPASSASIV